jgi:nucleobase:cation symporter-1, NCS1 family
MSQELPTTGGLEDAAPTTGALEGVSPTTDAERHGSPRDMFFVWGGVNVAVTNIAVGSLGIVLGLSLLDVFLVYLIGGAIGALTLGIAVVQGQRTGAPVMVNSRPVFGYRGAYLMAALLFLMSAGWFGVNSFFGMTAARSITDKIGLPVGNGMDLILLGVIVVVQVLIAIYGFNAIRRFERVAVGAMVVCFGAITLAALNNIEWSHPASVSGAERFGMIALLTTALGVGWAVSWTPWAHDFGRYVRRDASQRATFWWAWAGMYVVNLWVMSLSAAIATRANSGFDVGATVDAVMGSGIAIPVLLIMTFGLISANVVPLFSGGFALLTLDLKLPRRTGTILTAAAGIAVPVIGVFQASFAETFDQWMLTLLMWIGPWLTITLLDYFVLHRGHYTYADLYSERGAAGRVFLPGIVAWTVGFGISWLFANTPIFTSPLMRDSFGGADLSLFAGAIVAGAIYYPWAKALKERSAAAARVSPPEREVAKPTPAAR